MQRKENSASLHEQMQLRKSETRVRWIKKENRQKC